MYNVMRSCAAVEGEETEVKWPLALPPGGQAATKDPGVDLRCRDQG